MKLAVLYVPISGISEAKDLLSRLIEARIIACGNIISTGISIYEWEGKLVEENEVYILMKTRAELLPELKEKIGHLHPYSVPCMIQLSVEQVNQAYLEWVYQQTNT